MNTLQNEGDENENQIGRCKETSKTIFIFYCLGFLVCFLAGVVLTSAEDLLYNDKTHETGVIWIVYAIPFLLFSVLIAFMFDRIPTLCLVVSFFPLMICSIMALCLGETSSGWIKFMGVFLIGTTDCVSEVVAIALAAYFDKVTVLAFCVGSGIAYVFGPLYYTALTSWLHIHPKIVLMTLIIHPVGFLSCYLLLENRRDKSRFEAFQSMDDKVLKKLEYLSFKQKCREAFKVIPTIAQIFISFMLNDMVVSGVTTTIAFKNSPFSPADHYKYYLMLSFGGLFLGRGYLGILELIKPGLADKLIIRRTWVLTVLAACHVIVLVLASLYRFLPNVWVTMLLVFSLGFWSEATFANINVILGEIEDRRIRELLLGLSVYGVGLGNLMGSVISGIIEKPLLMRCLQTEQDSSLCYTRHVEFNPNETNNL